SRKIYCKRLDVSPKAFQIADTATDFIPEHPLPMERLNVADPTGHRDPIYRYVNQIVLSRYGPTGIVVNESLRITEYRGDMSEFLRSDKRKDSDLMNALRPELRMAVSTALEQARRTHTSAVAESSLSDFGQRKNVGITVIPLTLAGIPLHFLVL